MESRGDNAFGNVETNASGRLYSNCEMRDYRDEVVVEKHCDLCFSQPAIVLIAIPSS